MLRPGVLVFLAILIIPALWNLIKTIRHRLNQDKDDTHDIEVDDETPLADSPYSIGVTVVAVVIFAAGLALSAGFSPEAGLCPGSSRSPV